MESKDILQRNNTPKVGCGKINKIDRLLARLIKKKE